MTQTAEPNEDGLPTIELHELENRALRVLRGLQMALLKHPIAGQAAFNGLLAEGRTFASTDQGQRLKRKLERSALLHRARLVFDLATLSMLEEDPPDIMPSSYIDVLFMLGSSDRSDEILDRLFREEPNGDRN